MRPDSELLHRYHRLGDALAFAELVRAHSIMVHATACRVTQNAALAEEVAQEVFLALAHRSHEAILSVPAWLHRITWVKAQNAVRGEARRRRMEHEAALKAQEVEVSDWEQLSPEVDAAMDELPEALRSVLIEHFLERRSQIEIAARLGMSQSSISRLIAQGVQQLRDKLRERGLIVGAGLATLLEAQPVVALPAGLSVELGKIALSGPGVGQLPPLLLMTTKTQIAAVGLLVLACTTLSYQLTKPSSTAPTSTSEAVGQTQSPAAAKAISPLATQASPTAALRLEDLADTPESRMAKLRKLTSSGFDKLMRELVASGDAALARRKLKGLMGLDFTEEEMKAALHDDKGFTMAVLKRLAANHPLEALAWLAGSDDPNGFSFWATMGYVLESHPDINVAEVYTKVSSGPYRDLVLSLVRAQRAPMAELSRVLTTTQAGTAARYQAIRSLAAHWPKRQHAEAAQWAMNNLQGDELRGFLPELLYRHAETSPDETLDILRSITDPAILSVSLTRAMRGLVQKKGRVSDVLSLIDSLQGDQRAKALAELSGRWVRVDQKGLLEWINQLESPADFDATLPMTLPQLTKDNRKHALDSLMSQIDEPLESTLIQSINPSLGGIAEAATEIVHRLMQLPQLSSIGSGQKGNQELLWKAVNQLAADWVVSHGGSPQKAAQWIDSLTFRTPADKAAVATQLYRQWKLRDPAAAGNWAARMGVNIR